MPTGGLRACVLSGGASRRMGRDKALLPHPNGGVWLSELVNQLRALSLPVVVVSGHSSHQQLLHGRAGVELLDEQPAGLGPLHALGQLVRGTPTGGMGGGACRHLFRCGVEAFDPGMGIDPNQAQWPLMASACSPCWGSIPPLRCSQLPCVSNCLRGIDAGCIGWSAFPIARCCLLLISCAISMR